jgi:hypothetical protein
VTDLEALVQRAISTICDIDPARVQLDAGSISASIRSPRPKCCRARDRPRPELPVDVLRRRRRFVRGIATELRRHWRGISRPQP